MQGCSELHGNNKTENCQLRVKECADKEINRYDKIIGLCKGTSCSRKYAGCAAMIPGMSVVLNTEDNIIIAKKRATHELGHAFGLYHIKSENGTNGCWDDEGGACQNPNQADCSLSSEERSKNIMAYCPLRETYGTSGYNYLKDNEFKGYFEVCK